MTKWAAITKNNIFSFHTAVNHQLDINVMMIWWVWNCCNSARSLLATNNNELMQQTPAKIKEMFDRHLNDAYKGIVIIESLCTRNLTRNICCWLLIINKAYLFCEFLFQKHFLGKSLWKTIWKTSVAAKRSFKKLDVSNASKASLQSWKTLSFSYRCNKHFYCYFYSKEPYEICRLFQRNKHLKVCQTIEKQRKFSFWMTIYIYEFQLILLDHITFADTDVYIWVFNWQHFASISIRVLKLMRILSCSK